MNYLMGLEMDPKGSVIAATSEHNAGVLHIFDETNKHCRKISFDHVKPSGVALNGQHLYILDILRKTINFYEIDYKKDRYGSNHEQYMDAKNEIET